MNDKLLAIIVAEDFMKKILLGIVLIAALAIGAVLILPEQTDAKSEYLRIHIRANSNDERDQAVKLKVKDAVVEYLIPLLAKAETKEDAERILRSHKEEIASEAARALEKEGYSYGAKADVKSEEFPVRQYGSETFPSGVYDALIVELGEGKGDNWWCVAFPPLCFTPNANSKNIVYKSKIIEIINKWKEKNANND